MINTVKLVKGDKHVIVNDDPSDVQFVFWASLGFSRETDEVVQVQASESDKPAEDVPAENTEAVAPLSRDEYLAMPKATLISMAQTANLEVTEQMSKDTIINLLMGV